MVKYSISRHLMIAKEKNSINRRSMLKISGVMAAGALLASCTRQIERSTPEISPDVSKETVTLMHVRQELTAQQEAQFTARHPNIPIAFIEADPTRFFAMVAAGTPPNLVRCQVSFIPQALLPPPRLRQ